MFYNFIVVDFYLFNYGNYWLFITSSVNLSEEMSSNKASYKKGFVELLLILYTIIIIIRY